MCAPVSASALVIGAGPAGLMAAERLALAGHQITVADAKPSVGRKFLMAGKSGLNLTRDEPIDAFIQHYCEAAPWLRPMLTAFGPNEVQDWARALGQELFTGTTQRVFPKAMKASPLLRAWLLRLSEMGVVFHTNWRCTGFADGGMAFQTPDGPVVQKADAVVLALGGASWARLGSDGAWADWIETETTPFAPANVGLRIEWSAHMAPFLGQPIKGAALRAGAATSRGEFALSKRGIEGGGVYMVSRAVREGAALTLDLFPDQPSETLAQKLDKSRGKTSFANHLRKTLRLDGARKALVQEWLRPLPTDARMLARAIKAIPVPHLGLRPLDEAISTAGGIPKAALTDSLMLNDHPGVFAAGEMLDWEAPTGGYLLTACFATGRWAGDAANAYLSDAAPT